MKAVYHNADTRGFADHGWSKSHHTFSFANYHDPEQDTKKRVINKYNPFSLSF